MISVNKCSASVLDKASFPPYLVGELALLLRESGIDTSRWLAGLGIEGDEVFLPTTRLSYSQIRHFVAKAIAATGDDALGLRVGLRQNVRSLGALGLVLATSSTIQQMIDISIPIYPEAGALVDLKVVIAAKDFSLHVEPLFGEDDIFPFLVEEFLAANLCVVRDIVGARFGYKRIEFSYPRPRAMEAYQRTFACPLKFQAPACRAVIDSEWLGMKIPGANPIAFHQAASALEAFRAANRVDHRDEVEVAVERVLLRNIHGGVSMQDVADVLHVSTRTLRRRLDERGTTFRAIADRVYRGVARDLMLDGEYSIAEVGEQLGFSDVRSFRRAFEQWYGISPAKWLKARAVERAARPGPGLSEA